MFVSKNIGKFALEAVLPLIGIDEKEEWNVEYQLGNDSGSVLAVFNQNVYKANWKMQRLLAAQEEQWYTKIAININTPIHYMKKVRFELKFNEQNGINIWSTLLRIFSHSLYSDQVALPPHLCNEYIDLKLLLNEESIIVIDYLMTSATFNLNLKHPFSFFPFNNIKAKYDHSNGRKLGEASMLYKADPTYNIEITAAVADSYKNANIALNITSSTAHPTSLEMDYQFDSADIIKMASLNLLGFSRSPIIFKAVKKLQSFELISMSPWTDDMVLSMQWDNTVSLTFEHNGQKIALLKLAHNIEWNDYRGKVMFSAIIPNLLINMAGLPSASDPNAPYLDGTMTFDFGVSSRANRTVQLRSTMNSNDFFNVDGTFQTTEDTFDGRFTIQCSKESMRNIKMRIQYNISAKPSATFTVERNSGPAKVIRIQMLFDNIIPTILITTPFQRYENIALGGNYKIEDGGTASEKQIIDFEIKINDKKLLRFVNYISYDRSKVGYPRFSLVSTLRTPTDGWPHEIMNKRSLSLELGWSFDDPFSANLKLEKDGIQYSGQGKLSIIDKEFTVNLISPHEGYEHIDIGGKFGTTTVSGKQLFGVNFQHNMVKRDLEFEYGTTGDGITEMKIRTPLRHLRSVTARSMILSDMGHQRAHFHFETEGEQDCFGFGVDYKFSRGFTNGHINGLLKIPHVPWNSEWIPKQIEGHLDYKDVDGILRNGFDIDFQVQ